MSHFQSLKDDGLEVTNADQVWLLSSLVCAERGVAQWLQHDAFQLPLSVVWAQTPLCAGFLRNNIFLPYQIFNVLGKALHFHVLH